VIATATKAPRTVRVLARQILACAASGAGGETLEEIARSLDIEKSAPLNLARRALAESVGAGTWREARAEAALRLGPSRMPMKKAAQRTSRVVDPRTAALRHGHTSGGKMSPTYRTWTNIRRDGADVCERWRRFDAFLADLGTRPDGSRIKRIDRARGFEPGNVRWVQAGGGA